MRKWLWIGGLTFALGGACGYWYFGTKPSEPVLPPGFFASNPRGADVKNDGNAETSEVFEPIIVDRAGSSGAPMPVPAVDDGPMLRVALEPGMVQPPRPDAGSGRVLRMPYADEEEILDLKRPPLARILDPNTPALKIFEDMEKANPAEESESKDASTPAATPPMDYHHQQMHCPYTGGCPYPYRRY